MAPLPSRKSLESMKRVDLQRLCKDYGVKANLKSEALIDLLIDTAKPAVPSTPTRRPSSSKPSSRAGPSRISSIVIHDTDEEEEEEEESDDQHPTDEGRSDRAGPSQHEPVPSIATRTRKGKEQTRLGVGRPVVAGGSGPRAVTRSLSISKGKRGKASRSLKPTEATIVEEEIEQVEDGVDAGHENLPIDIPSQDEGPPEISTKPPFAEASIESLATIDKHVADALRPLHEQMKSMKTELELVQALKSEVEKLKNRVDEMESLKEKVQSLTATVRDLRKKADEATTPFLESNHQMVEIITTQTVTPSTPKMQSSSMNNRAVSSFGLRPPSLDTSLQDSKSKTGSLHHPGIVPPVLGKRRRESTASEAAEMAQETNLIAVDAAEVATERARKRAKITEELAASGDSKKGASDQTKLEEPHESAGLQGPSFRVFSGLELSPMELIDPPPPTENLPDFFPPLSPAGSEVSIIPRQGHAATSTANAAENQPFAFSFQHPISSTPAHGVFMPSFPYPEPPQSPSPAGNNIGGFVNQPGRSDVFQAFGFPPPGRPSRTTGLRNTSGLAGGFVDPSALTRRSSGRDELGETTARGMEAGSSTGPEVGTVEAPQMKRTMYGTELDGDTRFGDFGVEGVGNSKGGFWTGGRF